MHSVINDEVELSIVANKISAYADFLSVSIAKYNSILNNVEINGIKDILICAQLSSLILKLQINKNSISNLSKSLSNNVTNDIHKIEQADTFSFPASRCKDPFSNFGDNEYGY